MEDLKSLILGILGGLIVLIIAKAYNAYRKKSIKEDIDFLEYEKKHLAEMKRSSIEMNRSSFKAIFSLFLIIGIANLISKLIAFINVEKLSEVSSFITLIIWGIFVSLCIIFWRRYDNLKNYKEAIIKIDRKLSKLNNKLKNN